MYARGTLLRFTSWVVLFSLTTFTFEGSVWAAERVSRDAKPVVTGDRDLPREARDALARIRRTISEQGIATSPPGNLRDFQPLRRGPQPVRFGPTLRGIDAAYEKFRAEFLAELEGQSGDSSRLTALANELKTFLAEYLDLLDKRGEYMVVQRLPERIQERHARNVQIANERVADLLAMIDRALAVIAGSAKAGDAEEVGAFFTENRATQTEVKIARNHLLRQKGFAQEQFQEKPSPDTESAGKSGVFALAGQGEPIAADTAPTADIRITQEMIDLAGSFGNSPTGIVSWVRNSIGYMPYYGSLKGSELTLLDKAGNDLDTCSLTMALLRAAGIPCRYVIGTVEFDYETYRNLVGVDTKDAVSAVLGTQEKPGGVLLMDQATGLPTAVQVGHVWVAAYLPVNYRGTGSGPTRAWIQFDPSVRSFQRTDRAPVSAITDKDPTAIAEEIQAAAVYDATQGKLLSFNKNVAHSISADTAAGVDSFYTQNSTGGNFFVENDLLYGKTEIVADNWDVFPISLPFKVKLTNSVVSEVPSGLQYKVSFTFTAPSVDDPYGFEPPVVVTRSYASAELAAKRVTVFALPQSADDTTAMYNVNATAPTIQFPDGSTGELSRLSLIQADAVNVLPVLFVDGQHQMLGPIQSYGAENDFQVGITGPEGTYNETSAHKIRAGGYHAVAIDMGNTETELSTRMMEGIVDRLDKLATTIEKQAGGSGQRLTEEELIRADDLVGAALYMAALNYFVELNYKEKQWANSLGVLRLRNPSVCVVSQEMVVDESADVLGRITREILGGVQSLEVDVDLEMQTVISKNRKVRDFTAQPLEGGPPLGPGEIMKEGGVTREEFLVGWSTGVSNSETEHRVMERQLGKPSFSAMKMLGNALEQGKPMLMISKAQLATEAGRALSDSEISAAISEKIKGLSTEPGVEAGIKEAVQQGKMVFAVESPMSETAADDPNFQQYHGTGYIFVDPADGSGGYIITGQAGGSAVLCGSETSDVAELVACAKSQLGALAPTCCCAGMADITPTSNSVADAAQIDGCAGCAANVVTAFIDVSGVIGDAITCMVADLVAPAMAALTSQIDDMLAAYPNGGRGVQPTQELRRMADTISVTLIAMLGLFSNTTSQLLDSLGISLPFPPGTGAILGGYMAIFMAHFLVLDLMLENPDF